MSEHYTRSTVSVAAWCNKCWKHTQHRVGDCRKGPCLECVAKLEREHDARTAKVEPEKQLTFFGDAA